MAEKTIKPITQLKATQLNTVAVEFLTEKIQELITAIRIDKAQPATTVVVEEPESFKGKEAPAQELSLDDIKLSLNSLNRSKGSDACFSIIRKYTNPESPNPADVPVENYVPLLASIKELI